MTQTHFQSDAKLAVAVYIDPPIALALEKSKMLRVVKALYGLTDAPDYWHSTFSNVLTINTSMPRVMQ